jgi:hypothetical protein
MNTLSTLRKRKAEDSPQGGQKGRCKASNQAVIRGMDRGKQRGYPYQMHDKTEHPREARRSMRGIEPSGDPKDAPRKAKGVPLPNA